MSSTPREQLSLTESQTLLLREIYRPFAATGEWPLFQYASARLSAASDLDPSRVYFQLSALGLVSPSLTPEVGSLVREDTRVAVSLDGLAHLDEAAADRDYLVLCLRYLAERARRFQPPDPTTLATLTVTSEEIAPALDLPPDDPHIVRVGGLIKQVWPLWSSMGQQGSPGVWRITLRIDHARRFADVTSFDDLLASSADEPPRDPLDGPGPATPQAEAPEDPAPGAQQLRFTTSVATDLPATVDLLGFRPLVRALRGLLNDSSTVLPLAVAITAPWGTGKSSVMRQLQMALHDGAEEPCAQRRWATVYFDAWKYERGERLWAALAKAIYSQPQHDMTRWQRIVFRVRLEHRRRGSAALLGAVAWPCLVIAAIAAALVTLKPSGPGAVPGVIATAAVTLGGLTRYGKALANPFARAVERHARRPDYEAQLGFTADADRDVHVLTELLAPDDEHGLAVFVDDLDRCSSAHLVEVVEAMNQIFNSARNHRCVFVLGLDREVVTTNLRVAYSSTVAQLRADGSRLGDRFGLEFMAKLVQLSVSLPEPTPEALRCLLEAVTGSAPPPGHDGEDRAPEPDVSRVQTDIQAISDGTLASVADAADRLAAQTASPSVVAEAARRALAERIEDSPEVAQAEFSALPYLERNARQVKRFHNAFRLQLYVANEDETVHFDFSPGELMALAKWVVVRLRWPDLGNALAQDPALLELMEASANDEPPTSVDPELTEDGRLVEQRDHWLAEPGVRPLMAEPDPGKRLSALELKRFLRVA